MKVGVIDIGTRATRLLIGDTDALRANGFRFSDHRNWGELTDGGLGITTRDDGTRYLRVKDLEKTILAARRYLGECAKRGVSPENIHIVGTELFRRVDNWREIVSVLRGTLQQERIIVLDPLEEAECTFWAAVTSCAAFYKPNEPFIIVEQGGGSIQINLATVDEERRPTRHKQASIPRLGTILLRQEFLGHEAGERLVGTVHRQVGEYALAVVEEELKAIPTEGLPRPVQMFALGAVITDFAEKKMKENGKHFSSKDIHGKELNRELLEVYPKIIYDELLGQRYANVRVSSLLKDAQNGTFKLSLGEFERVLQFLYGLPCYVSVMRLFGIDGLRICGTGMRYGVFFRIAHDQWHNIREHGGAEQR